MANLRLNDLQLQMLAALESGQGVTGVRAGWGSGKTTGIVFCLLWLAKTRRRKDGGPARILLITDTSDRYHTTLGPEIEKWLKPMGWEYTSQEGRRWSDPQTGTVVWVRPYFRPKTRSIDHNSLEGIDADCAIIDECQTMQPEVASRALGRIRSGNPPQLLLVGVPTWNDWWIRYARKYASGDESSGGRNVIFATSHVNRRHLGEQWFDLVRRMSPAEYREKVLNQPRAPEGAVYGDWLPVEWPAGNLAPSDWQYDCDMLGYLAADWGYQHPAGLVIVEDVDLDADVIVAERNPTELQPEGFAAVLREVLWPRRLRDRAPGDRYLVDRGAGDIAGRQSRTDRTLPNCFQLMRKDPDEGGLGMALRHPTNKKQTNILNGVEIVRRLICDTEGRRRLLITREVWEAGLEAEGVSFAKAITSYVLQHGVPKKFDGDHPLDALRYWAVVFKQNDGIGPVAGPPPTPAAPLQASKVVSTKRSWAERRPGR